jgi:hypothetical protein
MPEFFIPYVDSAAKAEEYWSATKTFMENEHGWRRVTDRRIFRLEYIHNGKNEVAQVGEPRRYGHPPTWEYKQDFSDPKAGEWVVVILENEGGPFLVCTHNRGFVRGEPILVGIDEVYKVVYFNGCGPEYCGVKSPA